VAPAPSGFWREICGALAIGVAALAGVVLVLTGGTLWIFWWA
jgi:hypothetical protein